MTEAAPLVLTLSLDEQSFQFFNDLRQCYFPSERNYLKAHLTLFHHLPANEPQLQTDLERWSLGSNPLTMQVVEVKSIGKGVAYKIECDALVQLHTIMRKTWNQWLQPQDKQKLWPHVTVQNKVSPQTAKETLAILQEDFTPFTATGSGFDLWRYDGGPWSFVQHFPFANTKLL